MRKICFFNQDPNSKLVLNLYSRLARLGKKVLIVDLRLGKKDEDSKEKTVYHLLNENLDPKRVIMTKEQNLDVIQGDHRLNLQEFNSFYNLFQLNHLSQAFGGLNYDYIILEVSDNLGILVRNALHFCNEIMCAAVMDKNGQDFIMKLARFSYHFNKLYGMQIFLSKLIPVYEKEANKKEYDLLVSEFTTNLVSEPIIHRNKKAVC